MADHACSAAFMALSTCRRALIPLQFRPAPCASVPPFTPHARTHSQVKQRALNWHPVRTGHATPRAGRACQCAFQFKHYLCGHVMYSAPESHLREQGAPLQNWGCAQPSGRSSEHRRAGRSQLPRHARASIDRGNQRMWRSPARRQPPRSRQPGAAGTASAPPADTHDRAPLTLSPCRQRPAWLRLPLRLQPLEPDSDSKPSGVGVGGERAVGARGRLAREEGVAQRGARGDALGRVVPQQRRQQVQQVRQQRLRSRHRVCLRAGRTRRQASLTLREKMLALSQITPFKSPQRLQHSRVSQHLGK